MLYDVRTYTCRPGTIKKHLALYAEFGYEVQSRHLGKPVVYAATETGNVNSFLHIWVYENAADREKRRAAMQADPAWHAFTQKSGELGALIAQENKLATSVDFFKP